MNFQTLPKQFDKISKDKWKIGLGVLTGLAFLSLFTYLNFKNPTPEQTNASINNSKALQKVDSLRENIPKPEDFRFVKKIVSGNSYTVAISYYYKSELHLFETEKFYLNWFGQNGWALETEGTLEFRKKNLRIVLMKGSWGEANYAIYCAEEF